ncbi:hypothetical protein RUND412_003901 [Rhizina undulata]
MPYICIAPVSRPGNTQLASQPRKKPSSRSSSKYLSRTHALPPTPPPEDPAFTVYVLDPTRNYCHTLTVPINPAVTIPTFKSAICERLAVNETSHLVDTSDIQLWSVAESQATSLEESLRNTLKSSHGDTTDHKYSNLEQCVEESFSARRIPNDTKVSKIVSSGASEYPTFVAVIPEKNYWYVYYNLPTDWENVYAAPPTCDEEDLYYVKRTTFFKFSIPELKVAAAQCVASTSGEPKRVLKLETLGWGTYHKVFLVTFTDGTELVARISSKPHSPRLKTESEVATMKFIKKHTSIPIPEVYAWNSNPRNPVGAEYIFVEKVTGDDGDCVWELMTANDDSELVNTLASYELQLRNLPTFDKIGSLYMTPQGEFYIGPIVSFFFDFDESAIPVDRGPWNTVEAYLDAMVKNYVTWLQSQSCITRPVGIEVIKAVRDVIGQLVPADVEGRKLALRHPDLASRNLLVDKRRRIRSVLDWEFAYVGPVCEEGVLADMFAPSTVTAELATGVPMERTIARNAKGREQFYNLMLKDIPDMELCWKDTKSRLLRRIMSYLLELIRGGGGEALEKDMMRVQYEWRDWGFNGPRPWWWDDHVVERRVGGSESLKVVLENLGWGR